MPNGTRAIQLWDNRLPSYFLDTFGRSERESPCECAKSNEPTMAQTLHLMNAPELEAKITSADGSLHRFATNHSVDETLDELCWMALGRAPSATDRQVAAELFANENRQQAAEDLLWSLLNSYDFLFNH